MAKRERLETLKTYSTILSSLTMPVIVAVLGWTIQSSLAQQSASKDLALSAMEVLRDPNADPRFKSWARRIVEQVSGIEFEPDLAAMLDSGEVNLPGNIWRVPDDVFPQIDTDWLMRRPDTDVFVNEDPDGGHMDIMEVDPNKSCPEEFTRTGNFCVRRTRA